MRTGGAGEGQPCADHEERKEEDVWGLEAGMQRRCQLENSPCVRDLTVLTARMMSGRVSTTSVEGFHPRRGHQAPVIKSYASYSACSAPRPYARERIEPR